MSVSVGQLISATDIAALWALANGKASLTGTPYGSSTWLTEMNRLRADAQSACNAPWPADGSGAALAAQVLPWAQAISGPWPCNPSLFYNDLTFIYPDTGGTVTVSLGYSGSIGGHSFNAVKASTYNTQSTPPTATICTQITFNLVLGGNQAFTLAAGITFAVKGIMQQGTQVYNSGTNLSLISDGTDPSALASVDDSNWIPGAGAWVKTTSIPGGVQNSLVIFTCTLASAITLTPGRIYTVILNGAVSGDDTLVTQWVPNAPNGAADESIITNPSRVCLIADTTVGALFANVTI